MTTLEAALQEACFMELENIPSEETLSTDETLTFSPAFEKKIRKLIRRADHPIRYRVAQAAACFLLAILLSGSMILTFSIEARAAFFGWIKEVYETYFAYHYTGPDQEALENMIYRPTWLPDGYEAISEPTPDIDINIVYENESGDMAIFSYCMNTESLDLHIERDGVTIQHTFVGDYSADLYIDDDPDSANILVWTDDEKNAIFLISAIFSGDEMIRMAESVETREIVDTAEAIP